MNVWNSLRLMEHTPALKYQWQRSHCNDLLLCAIDIDARNIVRQILYFILMPFFQLNVDQLVPFGSLSTYCRRQSLG